MFGDAHIIQCITTPVTRNGHRYYLHVVYNPAIRADAEKDFIELLATCKKEFEEHQHIDSHQKLYEQFFQVHNTDRW